MGLTQLRKSLRAVGLAAMAAFALGLTRPAFAAERLDPASITRQLQNGQPALTAELAELTIGAREKDFVAAALKRHRLKTATSEQLRSKLKKAFMEDADDWAKTYLLLKEEQLSKAVQESRSKKVQTAGVDKAAKRLNIAKRDFSDLDKTFDNQGRRGSFGGYPGDESFEQPTAFGRGDDGDKAGWNGNKPPQNGGNGGRVTFDDVVGIDEQKAELMEIVDMIKNPERYRKMGADIPTGVLMAGPPGTGKTFTARALANEAGVTFMSMEGTAFIDKYVGESAKKVREFFAEARQKAPCIVFIDEIEALAGKRLDGDQGAERETNGAVTQLLVEMDGLTENPDGTKALVIVVGATNRIDMLDPAVMRPGRFDRKVVFTLPDVNGRKKLLDLYVKKKKVPTAPDYDAQLVAHRTTGMSPADIKNLVNEAATLAARDNKLDPKVDKVMGRHFLRAIDRLAMGKERKMVMSDKDKKQTAIHELGHAVVGTFVAHGDPITKITVIPRDTGAGGVTMSEPAEGDRLYWTKNQFLARIAMAMGGRAAEQIFFSERTTGPSSDLENATNIARAMVMQYGMSDELGPVTFVQTEEGNFLNRGGKLQAVSEATQQKVDAEVRRILDEQEKIALEILTQHKATVEQITPVLIEKETLEGNDFRELVKKFEGGGNGGGQNVAQAPKPEEPKPAESANPLRRFFPNMGKFARSIVGPKP